MMILLLLVVLALLLSFVCYYLVFYVPPRRGPKEEFPLPRGKIYEPHHERMREWMRKTRALPATDHFIMSFDGLRLHATLYEYEPGAPIELMFHGYRGSAERDLCGGVQRCFHLGHSAMLVDQRTSGQSQGHTITFGIKEKRDCLRWLDYIRETFGPEQPVILTGISMGASTVLMAGGAELPDNVVGILADCGFTSAPAIILDIMRRWPLLTLLYPFVWLGARLFGGFDLYEDSAVEAVQRCKVPVLFIHGEADTFVPERMSRENHGHCAAPRAIFTVPGAGHGLSYVLDKEGYLRAMREFFPL